MLYNTPSTFYQNALQVEFCSLRLGPSKHLSSSNFTKPIFFEIGLPGMTLKIILDLQFALLMSAVAIFSTLSRSIMEFVQLQVFYTETWAYLSIFTQNAIFLHVRVLFVK